MESFIGIFSKYYEFVSGGKEKVNIIYDSQLHSGEFKKLLNNSLDRDRALLYTTVGIHKDDLSFWIEKYPLKKFGSQGQQKSFIIGMKLAQFDYMKDIKGYKPVLLFDDIFDKLDHLRVEQLMKLVSQHSFGQVFITDTHPERIAEVFKNIDTECRIFEIINGTAQLKS